MVIKDKWKLCVLYIIVLSVFVLSGCNQLYDSTRGHINHIALQIFSDQYTLGLVPMYDGTEGEGETGTPVIHPIFSDIENLKQLDSYSTGLTAADVYVEGLEYKDSYTREIEFDGFRFKLFAYCFDTLETSIRYECTVTENETWFAERWYSWMTEPACYVCYEGKNAMRIEGERWETIAYFMDSFKNVFDTALPSTMKLMDEMAQSEYAQDAWSNYIESDDVQNALFSNILDTDE